MQDDRQDYAKKAREDWQEYAEWDEGGGYWVGGWYGPVIYDDDDVEWVTFLAGIAIGTALSSAAYQLDADRDAVHARPRWWWTRSPT